MHIRADKAELLEAITISRGNIHTDNTVSDVYDSVMISVDDDGMWVYATDGVIWSRVAMTGECRGRWQALIKNSQLADIVAGLDDGPVRIDFSDRDGFVTLKSGGYTAKFQTTNAMEFPLPPRRAGKGLVRVPAKQFADLVRSVENCASLAADRPYLQGINFEFFSGEVRATASDGYRLASSVLRTGVTGSSAIGVAPTRLARQGASLAALRPIGNEVLFGFENGWGFFQGDRAEICGTLNSHPYPNWREAALIPKAGEPRSTAEFDRKTLMKAMKRVVAIGAKLKGAIGVDLTLSGSGNLSIFAKSGGKTAEDSVHPLTALTSSEIERRVAGDLFARSLTEIASERVMLSIPVNSEHPVFLTSCGKDGEIGSVHYIMPRSGA
jgi:DNA polymerase-3 subunit beta